MRYFWCGKHIRQCKTTPSGPARIHPAIIPVTGLKCSYSKIFSPLTEISRTEPARPLIWTHRKFYKGFRGRARSRKPGSREEDLNRDSKKFGKAKSRGFFSLSIWNQLQCSLVFLFFIFYFLFFFGGGGRFCFCFFTDSRNSVLIFA